MDANARLPAAGAPSCVEKRIVVVWRSMKCAVPWQSPTTRRDPSWLQHATSPRHSARVVGTYRDLV